MSEPLLIVAPETWREACFSMPAVRALAASEPVSILCKAEQETFWQSAVSGEILPYNNIIKSIAAIVSAYKRVLLWDVGNAAKACKKAAVSERIGLPVEGLEKFLTHPLERTVMPGPPVHEVERYLDVAALMGADPKHLEFFAPVETEVTKDPDAILLMPGSDYGSHYEWPVENWQKLLEELGINHARVRVGGPRRAQFAKALGLPSLDSNEPENMAAFELCLTAENSMAHVAAAYGVTCMVLYGPGDPALVRPLGKQHTVIRHKVECSPCFADKCLLDMRCQNELGIDKATKLIKQAMAT